MKLSRSLCSTDRGDRRRIVRRVAEQRAPEDVVAPDECRRQLHQPLPGVDDDLARREQLAGEVRRTDRRAAPALGAGVAVEQVLPAQLRHVGRAEDLRLGLEIHRLHRPHGSRPAGVGEEGVGERDDDVQVLGVRQVVEEGQDEERVRPPAHAVQRGDAPTATSIPAPRRAAPTAAAPPSDSWSPADARRRAVSEQRDHQRADQRRG